ncbi:MAG: extracellular solute-binding protein [Lachnospiraceae bacterium]|nr:extracellular solute-binding protein [Lachnospiraceae bacterium]
MKKRIIALALVFCMLLPLAGCGSKQKEKLVLALRAGTYSDVVKYCLDDFEALNNVQCEVVELSEDELHSVLLSAPSKKGASYDLCMVDGSWVMEFINENVLTDLSALGYMLDDDIISATTTICVKDGKTYLAPYYGNVTVMLFNAESAKAVGVDPNSITSLDALLGFCKQASQKGLGGFVYRGDTENDIVVDFLPILRAFGGWVIDDNNRPTVNTFEFTRAMEFYIELCKTGAPLSKENLIQDIEAGKQLAAVGWPGWFNPETSKNSDYIPFPGKRAEESRNFNSNIYGIWTLGIPEKSTHKESACKLLSYLMDKEVQKKTVAVGGVPCRYSVLKDPAVLEQEPHFETICTALENGIYRPVIREWPRFYAILGAEMKKMMDGSISVSEGLKLAQESLEALMGSK